MTASRTHARTEDNVRTWSTRFPAPVLLGTMATHARKVSVLIYWITFSRGLEEQSDFLFIFLAAIYLL